MWSGNGKKNESAVNGKGFTVHLGKITTRDVSLDIKHVHKISAIPRLKNKAKLKANAIKRGKLVDKKLHSTTFLMTDLSPHMFSLPKMPSISEMIPPVKVGIDEESKGWISETLSQLMSAISGGINVNHTHSFNIGSLVPECFKDAFNFASDKMGHLLSIIVFFFQSAQKVITETTIYSNVVSCAQQLFDFILLSVKAMGDKVGFMSTDIFNLLSKFSTAIVRTVCSWIIPTPVFEEHSLSDSSMYLAVIGLVTFMWNGYDVSLNAAIKIVKSMLLFDGKKNIEISFFGFLDAVRSIFMTLSEMTGIEFFKKFGMPIPEFAEEMQVIELKHFALLSESTIEKSVNPWNKDDVASMKVLLEKMTNRIFEVRSNNHKLAPLIKMRDSLVKIQTQAVAFINRTGAYRLEPNCYCFIGKPGFGKTTLMHYVNVAFLASILKGEELISFMANPPEQVYNAVPGATFEDHYGVQMVACIDDFLATKATPGMPGDGSRLIRWVNNNPLLLNAAALENKSRLNFRSRLISTTSNVKKLDSRHAPDVAHIDAVSRRMKYVMDISTDKDCMYLEYAKRNPGKTRTELLDEYYKFRRINWDTGLDHPDQTLNNFSKFVAEMVAEDARRSSYHEDIFTPGMSGVIDEFSGLAEHMFPIPMTPKFKPSDLDPWKVSPRAFINQAMIKLFPTTYHDIHRIDSLTQEKERGTLRSTVDGFTEPISEVWVKDKAYNISICGDMDCFHKNLSGLKLLAESQGYDLLEYFYKNKEAHLKKYPNLYHCRYLIDPEGTENKSKMGVPEHFYHYLGFVLYLSITHPKLGPKVAQISRQEKFDSRLSDTEVVGRNVYGRVLEILVMFANEMAHNVSGFKLALECLNHACGLPLSLKKYYTLGSNHVQGWLPDYIWEHMLGVEQSQFDDVSICAYLNVESYRNCLITGVHFDVHNFMRTACFAAVEKYKKDTAPVQHYLTTLFNCSKLAAFAVTAFGFLAIGSLINRTVGALVPIDTINDKEEQSGRLTKVNRHVVRPAPLPKNPDQMQAHAVNLPASNGLVAKVMNNTIVFSTEKMGVSHGSLVILKDNKAIGLVHYLSLFEDLRAYKQPLFGRRGDSNPKDPDVYFPLDLDVLVDQCHTPSDGIEHDTAYYTIRVLKEYAGSNYRPQVGKDLTSSMLTRGEFSNLMMAESGVKKHFPTVFAKPCLIDRNSKVNYASTSNQVGAVIGNVQYGACSEYKVANAIMGQYTCDRGYCGAAVLCPDMRSSKQVALVSIHCSGNSQTSVGISAPFYLEDFEQYCSYTRTRGVLEEHGAIRSLPPGWTPVDPEPILKFYSDLGYDTKYPFMNETSKLVKNVFWDQCNGGETSGNIPTVLDRKTGLDPLYTAQSNYGAPCAKPYEPIVDEAFEAVTEIYLNPDFPVRHDTLLTLEETLVGVVGKDGQKIIQGIRSSTSPGWPSNNTCQDKSAWVKDGQIVEGPAMDRLRRHVEALEKELSVEDSDFKFVCLDSLKDEVRKVGVDGNVKPARLISCADLGSVCVTKRFFGAFVQFSNDNRIHNGSTIGVGPYKEFDDIWRIFIEWLLADGDYGKYDGNIWRKFYRKYAIAANRWYSIHDKNWKPEHDIIRLNIVMAISSTIHLSGYGTDKVFAMVEDHQPSGNFLTANANTFIGTGIGKINLCKVFLEGKDKCNTTAEFPTYKELYDSGMRVPREVLHTPSMQNGDDHFLAIPKCMSYMTPGAFSRSMNELGFKHTDSRKGVSNDEPMTLKDVSYLKREFVEFKHKYVGRLEYPSILKMIEYGKASQTVEEQSQVVDTMLMECAPHGMEKFRALSTKLQKYCEMKQIRPRLLALGRQDEAYEASLSRASAAFNDCDDFYAMM